MVGDPLLSALRVVPYESHSIGLLSLYRCRLNFTETRKSNSSHHLSPLEPKHFFSFSAVFVCSLCLHFRGALMCLCFWPSDTRFSSSSFLFFYIFSLPIRYIIYKHIKRTHYIKLLAHISFNGKPTIFSPYFFFRLSKKFHFSLHQL